MDLGIAGKVALVTGAARSLGRADAQALAAEGCRVAILDLNAEGAAEAAQEIGGGARAYACDITDRGQVAADARVVIMLTGAGIKYTPPELPTPIDLSGGEEDIRAHVRHALGA